VIKDDRTATVRPITVGEILEGEASINTGLSPGELVVVDGAERLREGSRVELKAPGGGTSPKGK
jgi:multidrug efflux system membrane fusion protein